VHTFMVGHGKISTQGVTLREEQSHCFRSSKGIALVATPVNAGSHRSRASGRQTVAPSCLTWLAPATSLQKQLAQIYFAVETRGLISEDVVKKVSSKHNWQKIYLSTKIFAIRSCINQVTRFNLNMKMEWINWQTQSINH
jgi:hypothetical protein